MTDRQIQFQLPSIFLGASQIFDPFLYRLARSVSSPPSDTTVMETVPALSNYFGRVAG
jgi:hypothetical protein